MLAPCPQVPLPVPGPLKSAPGPPIYRDPRLHNAPQFEIPNEIMDSVNRGASVVAIAITPAGVRIKVLATDGSGYIRGVDIAQQHFVISTQCIGNNGVGWVQFMHKERVNIAFEANRHLLETCIASLGDEVVVKQFYVTVEWNTTRPKDADKYRKWREDVCSGFWSGGVSKGFQERTRSGKRPLRVEKFYAQYDGSELGEDDVLSSLTWIQLVGPKEIYFRPFRAVTSELRIQGLLMLPTWRMASKFTMGSGFWTKLVPAHWRHFNESCIKVKSVKLAVLKRLLMHFQKSRTFVRCTIQLTGVDWDYRKLESIARRESEHKFIYEQRLALEVKEKELLITANN